MWSNDLIAFSVFYKFSRDLLAIESLDAPAENILRAERLFDKSQRTSLITITVTNRVT